MEDHGLYRGYFADKEEVREAANTYFTPETKWTIFEVNRLGTISIQGNTWSDFES